MITFKIKKEYFSLLLVVFFIVLMFRFPDHVRNGITKGLQICFYTIIPSLFPFMVISSYVIKSDIFSFLYKFLSPVTNFLFKQPISTTPVIFFSMIGGFPIGLKMVNELYIKEKITENQAERLSFFCMNAGPSFIITALGINMFKNIKVGLIIYISLCISSLLLGFFSRFLSDGIKNNQGRYGEHLVIPSLSASVYDGLQGILNICAWIVLFNALTECFSLLNFNEKVLAFSSSLFEVSTGCINSVGKFSLPVFSFFIGFGGICVHCQVLGYLKTCKIKYIKFFLSRIIHGVLSSIITYIILLFFPVDTEVFANNGGIIPATFSVSLPTFIMLIIMCIIMIFDIDRKRKMC